MRKKRRKPGWYVIAALISLFALYFLSNTGRNVAEIVKLELLRRGEVKSIRKARERREALKMEKDRLLNDSSYIEEIARREYGMKKKGEEIFYITNPDSDEADGNDGKKR